MRAALMSADRHRGPKVSDHWGKCLYFFFLSCKKQIVLVD